MTLVTPTTATIATATATTPTATNSAPNDSLILETTKGAACRSQLLQISQTPCSHNQGVPFLSPNPPSPTTLKSHFKASARKLGRFFGEQEDAIPMDISLISSAATSTATGHSSLESLLNSRIPLAYLLYTCIKEHSSENLFFILEVDHFKSLIRSNISSSSQPSTLVPSIAVAAESSSSPSSSHSHSSTLLVEGWTAAKHICNTYLNPSSQFEINIPNKLRISIIDAVKAYRRYNCHPKTSPSRSRSRSSNTGVNGGRDGCGGTRNVSPPPPPPSTLDDIEFLLLDLSSVFDEARKHIMKLLEASHVSFLKSREYKDMLDSLLVSSNNSKWWTTKLS